MLDRNLATRIQTAVDAQFDEQIAFTSELVKFPSVRGAEQTAQEVLARTRLRRR
jgi:acetylornithine deacetylase